MKKYETKIVLVTYCDVCGDEIVGNATVFNEGAENERHACHQWNELEQTRCDIKMRQTLQANTLRGQ